MSRIKSIVIYSIIILLCAAVAIGYLTSDRKSHETASETAKTEASSNGGTASASLTAATAENNTAGTGETTSAESTASLTSGAGADTAANSADTVNPTTVDAHVKEIMARSTAEPDPNPVIGIGRGTDYAKVTEEAIRNAGGLTDIVKKGDVVIIKPNICTLDEEGSCKTTDHRTVQKIADMAKELGASRVIVAEGTIAGNAFSQAYLQLNKYDTVKGVELVDLNALNEEDCYELKPEKSMTGKALFIPKVYMDADVVINVAKLKTHFQPEAVVSLSLKNAIGVPPGQIYGLGSKDGLHSLGLKESIVDINKIRKPDFSVIEGIVGGEGFGPLQNTPVDSRIILAGKDPVALDTVALTFMGYSVAEIPHVVLASEEKLGISDLAKIKVEGAVLDKIKMKFKGAFD